MSAVLEVAVGLSFLFFVLSLICSALHELLASAFAFRARTLAQGVRHLLDGKEETDRFYAHPLIKALYRRGRGPSYIPSELFALAVLDLHLPQVVGESGPDFSGVPSPQVRDSLRLLWREAGGEVGAFRHNVEKWFDDTMERVSGWYRRRAQLILLGLALTATVALNVNTIGIAQRLWTDAPLRSAVASSATAEPATQSPGATSDALQRLQADYRRLDASKLPLGWSKEVRPNSWWVGIGGWLLTVLAVSLGAPFWFDVLSRASKLRATGDKPEESK